MEKCENLILSDAPTGASFNRGKSKQDYGTPMDFMEAVVKKFGTPHWDLAADYSNSKAFGGYYTQKQNSLIWSWHNLDCLCWLNPPFSNIEPWAHKCKLEAVSGARILLLVPASVSTEWWCMHVHQVARVFFIRPRLKFVGCEDPYPKDLALCYFSPNVNAGYECWKWK